jgi:hypothetical protein
VLIGDLTPQYTLANATGTYNGVPYMQIDVGTLAPGQSLTYTVQFTTTSPSTVLGYTETMYIGMLES